MTVKAAGSNGKGRPTGLPEDGFKDGVLVKNTWGGKRSGSGRRRPESTNVADRDFARALLAEVMRDERRPIRVRLHVAMCLATLGAWGRHPPEVEAGPETVEADVAHVPDLLRELQERTIREAYPES